MHYLLDHFVNCDAKLAELNRKFIQYKTLVTSSEVRLNKTREQLERAVSERTYLRTANLNLLGEHGAAPCNAATLLALVADLKGQAQVTRVPPAELVDTLRKRDWYKV